MFVISARHFIIETQSAVAFPSSLSGGELSPVYVVGLPLKLSPIYISRRFHLDLSRPNGQIRGEK